MYQQSLTQTFSTEEIVRNLNLSLDDDRKLTSRDVLFMAVQVLGILAVCWAMHAVCV